jgi:superkiller protein 3
LHWKGRTLRALSRDEEALSCFDGALEIDSDDVETVSQRAGSLYNLQRDEEALATYNRALELTPPDDVDNLKYLTYWKAMTLRALDREVEALECLDEVLARTPDDPDAADHRAAILYNLNRYDEALAAYDVALALAPADDPHALNYWKGQTLYNLKRYEEALVAYDTALTVASPNDPHALNYWKGRALYYLDRDEESIACFDAALSVAPPDDPNRINYWKGSAFYAIRRYADALDAYDHALALDPENADTWYWKGMTLRRLNRDDEALACYEKAAGLAPDNTNAVVERAAALFRLERYDEALTAYDAALALAPANDPRGMNYWKARTLQRLNRDDEALAAFDKALELEPDRMQWWIERSVSCIKLTRYNEALTSAEKAITLDENNGYGWKLKGSALMGLAHYADALAAFERALQHIPDDGETRSSKGTCLYRLGRFDEALTVYDEAVRVNPDDANLRKNYAWAASNIRRATTDQRLRLRDGRWLGYLDYGDPDGDPVFWFHGAPGSRLEFSGHDELLKELRVHLIAPDRPGYGLSDFQPHRRLLDWPADVEQLADHLGIERFAVLGISAGGPHAAACAYAIPQRLTRVGLISSAPPQEIAPLTTYTPRERISNFIGRYFPWSIQHALYIIPMLIYRKYPQLFIYSTNRRLVTLTADRKAAMESVEYPSGPLSPVTREEILEPWHLGARGYAWDIRVCDRPWGFRPSDMHGVEVYLWHGELDPIVPVAPARAMAAGIPGCHATFYPDEDHTPYSHLREILTALISRAEGEQSQDKASDSPRM